MDWKLIKSIDIQSNVSSAIHDSFSMLIQPSIKVVL